ncbi:hypothetical protein DFH28DRAFT_989292 [Melampsora americana]|nr:hypothetical protein DFH28DRAFT_989292 [Melampsora americana]
MTCNTLLELFLAAYFSIGEVVPAHHLEFFHAQHCSDVLVNIKVMMVHLFVS